ncbi:hypothetical protein J3A83DRAFT_1570482 [Scleroderma citrinum]
MRLIDVSAFLERERSTAILQTGVLKEFHDGQTEYAILSHRWGHEVDYTEMVDLMKMKKGCRDEIRARDGYQKILNSCKQAKNDRVEWLWVDTCCIDKRSSSEVSEAINSMYRWYENSKMCYAYLHDFEGWTFPTKPNNDKFPKSNGWPEWFSRGWTLQELIAPRKLQFFNKSWKSLGTKRTHADGLNKITRVPVAILVDGLTSNRPCVAQIMSWAANRKTTRIEDQAYSLLGLLDVNMPMLYGEGKEAFQRLQLEIIRKSNDQSIFAWVPDRRIHWNGGGVLADDLSFFGDCHDIEKMEPDEYMIHLHARLPGGSSRPVSLADERLGTCSVTNRGIQIWLLVTPHDNCPTVFFRAALACCRWDRRPITIDLALWGPNYYRYPSTTRVSKSIPRYEKLYLSYQSQVYPDSTFKLGGYSGINRTLVEHGFTYHGSYPRMMPLDQTESLVLSGVNELLVAVYDGGPNDKARVAVVLGYCFGSEWVRATLVDHYDEETWKEYAEKVYNQMWAEGPDHMILSTHNRTHTHIVPSESWFGWAVELTRVGWPEIPSESTSRCSNIKLFLCGRTHCDEPARDSIKGNSKTIQLLAQMTKYTPDLNGWIDRDVAEARKWGKRYRGSLSPDGKPVQVKLDWPPKHDIKDAFHEQYIWSLLSHENIHSFFGIVTTFDESVSTVAEWVDEGDAYSYVQDPKVDPTFLVCLVICCLTALYCQLVFSF